jgi:protein TonB
MNTQSFSRLGSLRPTLRPGGIVVTVFLLHACGLWALQTGLLRKTLVEVVEPAQVLLDVSPAEFAMAPSAINTPPPPTSPLLPAPRTTEPLQSLAVQTAIAPHAAPAQPSAPDIAALSPLPIAGAANASNANASGTQPKSLPEGTPWAATRATLELPSSDAEHLNNPTPAYPALSKRLGEQGRVVIRTFISTDGTATQAHVSQSSGFDRLDQAALSTALKWHYAPGRRAGVAEAMWFDVPFNWVLR